MLFAAIGGALPSALPRLGLEAPFVSGLIVAYLAVAPLILAVVIWDYARFRKLQKGTLIGVGLIVSFWGAGVAVIGTSWWLAFGGWTARALAAA
jgi:hypothetical protein